MLPRRRPRREFDPLEQGASAARRLLSITCGQHLSSRRPAGRALKSEPDSSATPTRTDSDACARCRDHTSVCAQWSTLLSQPNAVPETGLCNPTPSRLHCF